MLYAVNMTTVCCTPTYNTYYIQQLVHTIAGCKGDLSVYAASISGSYLSILLLCVPLGVIAYVLKWDPLLVFAFNFLALVPLALLLGEITGSDVW